MIEDSVPITQNDLTTVGFQTFKVQGHEISSRSPETKRKFTLSSNRCIKTVVVQTSTPVIITSPVSQVNDSSDDIIFVNSLQYLLHT